ncbi:MAG: MarR family winged helix-turn-helix transcriptional regulator [Jatrophihabitans sp.]
MTGTESAGTESAGIGAPDRAEYESAVAGYTAAGADETVQRVVTALSRVHKQLDGFYRAQLADLELHRGDWGVLQALALQGPDGCLTPSRLADLIGVSPSTMTHRLDLLAERSLVERAIDQANRTRSQVRLTGAGRDLFRRAVLDADLAESAVLGPLSGSERATLAGLLEKLLRS